jgi:hypothetical protein
VEDPTELQRYISQQSFESDSDEIDENQHRNPLQQLLQISTTKTMPSDINSINDNGSNNGGSYTARISPQNTLSSISDEKKFVHIPSNKPLSTIPAAVDAFTTWRKGLWPPLSPFYRILLRCKCVSMREPSRSNSDISNSKKRNRVENRNASSPVPSTRAPLTSSDLSSVQYLGLEWTDFWDPDCLEILPTTFDR